MSQSLPFSEDQRDCLQEISNVAMGAAGESLAEFSRVFVELSIPVIRLIKPSDLASALVSLRGQEPVSGVVQAFEFDSVEGVALIAITESSFRDLAQQRGVAVDTDAEAQRLLLQLAQTITQVCLPKLAEQLGISAPMLAEPQVASLHVPLEAFHVAQVAGWPAINTVEINYHLEGHPFNCDLLLMLPDTTTAALCLSLDRLLA